MPRSGTLRCRSRERGILPTRKLLTLKSAVITVYLFCSFSLFCLLHVDIDRPAEVLKRAIPRTLREIRRSSFDWESKNSLLLLEETFSTDAGNPEIRVISLPRTANRRHLTESSLKLAGSGYHIFDAVDGLAPISDSTVAKYAGPRKAKRLKLTQNMSHQQMLRIYSKASSSKDVPTQLTFSLHERLRFGCYLSHVSL